MKLYSVLFLSLLSLCGCTKSVDKYPSDTFTAKDGREFVLTFFKHASLAIETGGKHIYIDPVAGYADYAALPKADLILITHSHSDHLDSVAIRKLTTPDTQIICDGTSASILGIKDLIMTPGCRIQPRDYVSIESVAAYNYTEGHTQFHPQERADLGYILTIGGTRIYIAGDGENTPEMKSVQNIDIAFLPVNQPYTMTVEQAVDAVKTIRPGIFYPYHYGEVDQKTDLDLLARSLAEVTEVRIRPME